MSPQFCFSPLSSLSLRCASAWVLGIFGGYSGSVHALGMPDLLNMMVQNHPAILSQLRLVQGAQADERGAEFQFYPTPSVSMEKVSSEAVDASYANGSRVTTLRLQQPIWTGGRLTATLDRAKAATDMALAAADEARQQLALRTIQAWGDWTAAQQKVESLEESVKTHEALAQLIARRIEGGLSPASDEVLAQGRLQQALAELSLWKSQQAMAKTRLEQLAGRPFSPSDLTQFDIRPVMGMDLRQDLTEQAWRHNPSVRKLEAQVKVQEKELAVKKARLFPEVYLRAERQMGSFTANGPSSANRVFLGLTSSFGAGFSAMTDVEAAQARIESLAQEIESTKRQIEEQVRTDQTAVASLQQRVASLQVSLASAQSLVQSWDRQFLAGRKSWVELMNAARDLAQSQTTLADVKASFVVSSWRLAVYGQRLSEVLASTVKAP